MKLLGMESMRRGAAGSDTASPYYANYHEEKANPYPTLPDPLLTQARERVTTPEQWWSVRRPEIVELMDREVYGRVPKDVPAVTWQVKSTTDTMFGEVPVIRKDLVGRADNSAYPALTVEILASVTTPKNARGKVPVMLIFSGGGFGAPTAASGGTTTPAACTPPPNPNAPAGRAGGAVGGRTGAPPAGAAGAGGRAGGPPAAGAAGGRAGGPPGGGRGGQQGPSWQAQALSRGWGFASLNTGSVQRDNGCGLTAGIIGLANKGQPRAVDGWGVLRAWAWGASRVLDYFETDPNVDAKRVGLEGHSRWGKATIVAMAYDPRFSIAYVSSSGAGGAKLNRRNWGELVENVAATSEYHWMAGNYMKYAGPLTWDDMPVDAHELIAMAAPRPVFISGGATQGDGWVDAKGMFMAAAGAQPVYALLGRKTMGTDVFPPIEKGLMDGDIAFRQHAGGHTDQPNWTTFLAFADRYWK